MKSVALVGTAQTSRDEANYLPPEVERWGLGRCFTFLDRMDRFFEVHTLNWIRNRAGNRSFTEYMHWLQRTEVPVYHLHPLGPIQRPVEIPLDALIERFGSYFTSSVAYMLATAIIEDYDRIYLYGVDMATEAEYGHQRAGCEYFIGWARGAGIEVIVPESSPILKAPLYAVPRQNMVPVDLLMEKKIQLARLQGIKQEEELALSTQVSCLKDLTEDFSGVSREQIDEHIAILKPEEHETTDQLVEKRAKLRLLEELRDEIDGLFMPAVIPEGVPVVWNGGKAESDGKPTETVVQ
tara:strand:+ start:1121 stop:2005 length:885 start_codon:yes stop_codon:yes gene_type:complete